MLSNKTYLAAAAGNFATESYQAGAVRFILFNQENNPYQITNGNAQAVYQISNVRLATLHALSILVQTSRRTFIQCSLSLQAASRWQTA